MFFISYFLVNHVCASNIIYIMYLLSWLLCFMEYSMSVAENKYLS